MSVAPKIINLGLFEQANKLRDLGEFSALAVGIFNELMDFSLYFSLPF